MFSLLVALGFLLSTVSAHASITCEEWFKQLEIKPADPDCEIKCTMSQVDMGSFDCPIVKVTLGDSKESVLEKLGPPQSKSTEKYQSMAYEALEYSQTNGKPSGYISIDPQTNKVASKSIWISESLPESEFSYLQRHFFPEAQFETLMA